MDYFCYDSSVPLGSNMRNPFVSGVTYVVGDNCTVRSLVSFLCRGLETWLSFRPDLQCRKLFTQYILITFKIITDSADCI